MLDIKDARIQSDSYSQRSARLDTLVLHYTAADLNSSLQMLRYRGVSVHYVLGLDGAAYRILEDNEVGWHAGLSTWKGKSNVNSRSIGIEIVNLDGNKNKYPEQQISALIELCNKILAQNPGITAGNIVGHSDIAPKRKVDPGSFFPWKRLANEGIGRWPTNVVQEPIASTDVIQSMLEKIGYPPPHAYGVSGDRNVYVNDPDNPPNGVTRIVRVRTPDILKAFQLRYEPQNASGTPTPTTMGMLRALG